MVSNDRASVLSMLQHNLGFDAPELWVDYAMRHRFRRVTATTIERCPDCKAQPKRSLGQFVYYSTLVRLVRCAACGLAWANVRPTRGVLLKHFEDAYKDDGYFLKARRAIFEHLIRRIVRSAPHGGRVLDIGGAKGHLMRALIDRRPDLNAVVHDLSESATRYAEEQFGIPTITGDVRALCGDGATYDVVVLSDVLYYEPDIAEMWSVLPSLMSPNGSIVIRVPNKFHLLRMTQCVERLLKSRRQRAMQASIKFFNPEHLLLLSRRYLETRLRRLGFVDLHCLPSPLLYSNAVPTWMRQLVFQMARVAHTVSRGRLVLTPSMLVCARYAS